MLRGRRGGEFGDEGWGGAKWDGEVRSIKLVGFALVCGEGLRGGVLEV